MRRAVPIIGGLFDAAEAPAQVRVPLRDPAPLPEPASTDPRTVQGLTVVQSIRHVEETLGPLEGVLTRALDLPNPDPVFVRQARDQVGGARLALQRVLLMHARTAASPHQES